MKNFSVLVFSLLILTGTFAQTSETKFSKALQTKVNQLTDNDEILVWVYFTDKGTTTDRYFIEPGLVVSQKSIERRKKVFGSAAPLTFRDLPVNSDYINQVRSLGIKMKWPSKWLNAVSGTVNKIQLDEISHLPFVKKLDVVYKLRKGNQPEIDEANSIDTEGNMEQPEGINLYDYGASYAQLQQINVPAVHDSGYTGQGVTICVMDAGFNRLSHDAFLSMNIIAAWDFVNNDPNVGDEGDLGTGVHGTMTLSNIGGFAPGNLIGPAFNSDYILAKTENTDSETPIEEDNWIAAMEWADSIGVDVTSTSLGYLSYDPPYPSYTWEDMDGNTTVITNGADYAVSIGIVVVNSAGNEGYNSSHNTLGAPADGDSVITAGSVTSTGSRSSFSSVGPTTDGRIKPDIMARGSSNIVASPSNDHNYTTASGTSFSCPLSAGVAALILCVNPNLTPMQVRDAMRNTASQSSSPDNLYGWGILNTLDAINYFPPTPTTFQLSVVVNNGWNLLSVPGLHPGGMQVHNWWPGLSGSVYLYVPGTGYILTTSTAPTEGYWVKHTGSTVYNYSALEIVPHDPINCGGGWILFGVYEDALDTADLIGIVPPVFGNSGNGYAIVDSLFPGYAYWTRCNGPQIIFPERNLKQSKNITPTSVNKNLSNGKAGWGKIIFTDAAGSRFTLYAVNGKVNLNQYEMPPLPPAGVFDVRFSSNRIAEDISGTVQGIDMRGVTHPLTVRVEGIDIRLMDETGKIINENLKAGDEIVISDAQRNKLMVSGEQLPTVYSLEQNYPNPFNPSTKIEFSLPETADVTLTIYNMLGQKIIELVNTKLESGKYSYTWNAKEAATGMYVYELRTDKYVSIKKMILLK